MLGLESAKLVHFYMSRIWPLLILKLSLTIRTLARALRAHCIGVAIGTGKATSQRNVLIMIVT